MTDILRTAVRQGLRDAFVKEIAQVVEDKTSGSLKQLIETAIDAADGTYETALSDLIEEMTKEALMPDAET